MHKQLRESTIEAMAMMMLGANAIIPHHDYRQGIGPKARKAKKAKRRMQKQSRRKRQQIYQELARIIKNKEL